LDDQLALEFSNCGNETTVLRASLIESCIMLFRRLTSLMKCNNTSKAYVQQQNIHHKPSCSLIDSRTSLSYSDRLSRYNLEQSTLAGDCRFGSANMEITLKITFSTLCTGLQRSEACSYMVGSSPGVCNIEMHTFPSGYMFGWNNGGSNFILNGDNG